MSERTSIRLAEAIERLGLTLIRERGRMEQFDPTPLTVTQRLALTLLVDDGPLRLGALAERMGTTEATATRTVDSLAALGLAERTRHPTDRRGVVIAHTRRGRDVLATRRHRLGELVENGLRAMPAADQERLVDLLDELNDLLARGAGEELPAASAR
jgi:DNA-binding MarR family transcriptional regulator